MDFCQHPRSEVRYRIIAGGARVLQRQCLDCGYSVGSFIGQKDKSVDYLATLTAWDDSHQKNTIAANRVRSDDDMARRAAEREQKRVEWWQWYNAYLQTPQWRDRRRRVLERDNHLCTGCRLDDATQVHHLTCAHVGNELLFELTSVCDACHDIAHQLNARGGPPDAQ